MYRLIDAYSVKHLETQRCIPFDERNPDYREYLAWVALGNEPEPAE